MSLSRRGFLKSLMAVPALVRSYVRPPWQIALTRANATLFSASGNIAGVYAGGPISHVEGFDWFRDHYIAPAVKHIVDKHMDGIERLYRSENWCGTFDLQQAQAEERC